jgi:thymidylate synthase
MRNDFYDLLDNINMMGKEVRPRGHLTKELINQRLILDGENMFSTPVHRPYAEVYRYWFAETCWKMSGDYTADKILKYAKMWGDIRNEDGTVNSNYGYRIFYRKNSRGLTAFEFALTCLQADKETRNAIMIFNEPDLCYNGNKDFICSQYMHFMIRENKLICIVGLRSSDAILGLYYNCPFWSLVHQQLYLQLKPLYAGLLLGRIEVNIDSAHIYEKHFELVKNILSSPRERYFIQWPGIIPLNKTFEWYHDNLKPNISTL